LAYSLMAPSGSVTAIIPMLFKVGEVGGGHDFDGVANTSLFQIRFIL
jgi:hypothetical protein